MILSVLLSYTINAQGSEEYNRLALHQFNVQQRYDSAAYYATLAIQSDSLNSMSYYIRAFAETNSEDMKKAFTDIQKAISLDSGQAAYFDIRGYIYDDAGKFKLALSDYDKAISMNPTLAIAYFHRGTTYSSLNEYNKALADYNISINLDSTYALAFFNRGIAYRKMGQDSKAMTDYNACIRLNKNYAPAYYNKGRIYETQHNFKKAYIEYDKAYRLAPQDIDIMHNRGVMLMDYKQDYNAAIKMFNNVLTLDNKAPYAYLARAMAKCHLKNYKEALTDIDLELSINPDDAFVFRNKGYILTEKGEYDRAIETYTRSLDLEENAEAYYQRGRNNNLLGKPELAKQDYKKAIQIDKSYTNRVPKQ